MAPFKVLVTVTCRELSPRQKRIARALRDGLTYEDIERDECMARHSIKREVGIICDKLNVRDRVHLVASLLLPLDHPFRASAE